MSKRSTSGGRPSAPMSPTISSLRLFITYIQRGSAAIETRNISRKDAKAAKEKRCHFERREKSFLDPSHSLGMTGLGPVPWRAWHLGASNIRIRELSTH